MQALGYRLREYSPRVMPLPPEAVLLDSRAAAIFLAGWRGWPICAADFTGAGDRRAGCGGPDGGRSVGIIICGPECDGIDAGRIGWRR